MKRPAVPVLAFVSVILAAPAAAAHITLVSPAPRHTEQKSGPCGVGANDARGSNVTTYQGGETITVRWVETVNHPGHYRISFDPDGHDDFVDPAAYDDYYTNEAVLVDAIPDESGSQVMYEQTVTLPPMSCDNCTLQLVQMMTDKPPYEIGTNDLYYQCADLVLEGVAETTGDATTGDATTGDATTEDATTGDAPAPTGTTAEPGSSGGDEPGPTTGSGTTADGGNPGSSETEGAATEPSITTGDPEEAGCGCRSEHSGGAGLGALVLLLAWRRRRS